MQAAIFNELIFRFTASVGFFSFQTVLHNCCPWVLFYVLTFLHLQSQIVHQISICDIFCFKILFSLTCDIVEPSNVIRVTYFSVLTSVTCNEMCVILCSTNKCIASDLLFHTCKCNMSVLLCRTFRCNICVLLCRTFKCNICVLLCRTCKNNMWPSYPLT